MLPHLVGSRALTTIVDAPYAVRSTRCRAERMGMSLTYGTAGFRVQRALPTGSEHRDAQGRVQNTPRVNRLCSRRRLEPETSRRSWSTPRRGAVLNPAHPRSARILPANRRRLRPGGVAGCALQAQGDAYGAPSTTSRPRCAADASPNTSPEREQSKRRSHGSAEYPRRRRHSTGQHEVDSPSRS